MGMLSKSFPKIILVILAVVPLFFFRASYIEPYDITYVQDHYYHSQWEIPNSPWGIGDDGLYQFSGYEIIRGRDPFTTNPEMPPVGKLLYGLSILLFNNPYFVILPVYFLTIIGFYFLTGFFKLQQNWRYLAVFFLITTPLFFTQLNSTTLDLMQTCWLLLHTLAVFNLSMGKKHWQNIFFTILAGLTFGLFIGTKFGVFSVFIILADIYFLHKQKKGLIPLVWITLLGLGVYLSSYYGHFIHGGNLVTWLKGQKWIFNFFLHNQPKGSPFFIFITLFTGIWTNFQSAREWTILWPASAAAFLVSLRNKSTPFTSYLMIFLSGVLITLTFNFYWTRYLLILFPFLIIFLVKFLAKRNLLAIGVIVIICLFSFFTYPVSSLEKTREEIKYAWEQNLYKDLYNYLPRNFQNQYNRGAFSQNMAAIDYGLGFPSKEISFSSNGDNVSISYQTPMGPVTNSQPVRFISENGRWKILWSWNLLLPNFSPGDKIEIIREEYKPGVITDSQNRVIAYWDNFPFVFVVPEKIKDSNREELLQNLADVTKISKEKIRILLFVKGRKNREIPIGFILRDKLTCDLACGVIVRPARLYRSDYCNGLPYVSSEKEIGGEIILTRKSGDKTILLSRPLGY